MIKRQLAETLVFTISLLGNRWESSNGFQFIHNGEAGEIWKRETNSYHLIFRWEGIPLFLENGVLMPDIKELNISNKDFNIITKEVCDIMNEKNEGK